MIKQTLAILGTLLIVGAGVAGAQDTGRTRNRNEARYRFVDENGDGINDFIRDHDGDGIPNCQDPDWQPPRDGSGNQNRSGQNSIRMGQGNGLGNGRNQRAGGGRNAFLRDDDGDGIPNGQDADWQRPLDGTGYQNRFGLKSFRNGINAVPGRALGRNSFARGTRVSCPGTCTGIGPRGIARRTN